MTQTHDKNRRPFRVGDVLKVYHYTAALRREKCYMYKQIIGTKVLGGTPLLCGHSTPPVEYFVVSHLTLDHNEHYYIAMDRGMLADYEIVQGTDLYPEHFKTREKVME